MTTSSQHHPFKQWFGWMQWLLTQASTPFSICFPHYSAGIQIYNTGRLRCVCSVPTDMQKAFTRSLVSCLQDVKTNLFSHTKCRLYQTEDFRSTIVWVPAAKLIALCQVVGSAFVRNLQIYQGRLVEFLKVWAPMVPLKSGMLYYT